MSPNGHPQMYAHAMNSKHQYGYGFLEPESFKTVNPGACGYIDGFGQWQPFDINLENNSDLESKGYTAIDTIIKADPDVRHWGPKETSTVKYRKTNLKAGGSGAPAGIPAEASIMLTFSLKSSFGAVLISSGAVVRDRFYHSAPFRKWAKQNAKAILENYPETKEHGFYVVTTTYSANDIFINAWTEKENDVSVGFKAGVTGAGEIAPSTEFYTAESASAWNKFSGVKRVMFFNGLRFRYRKIQAFRENPFGEVNPDDWGFRGGEDEFKIGDPEDNDGEYVVEMTEIGDDEAWDGEE